MQQERLQQVLQLQEQERLLAERDSRLNVMSNQLNDLKRIDQVTLSFPCDPSSSNQFAVHKYTISTIGGIHGSCNRGP